MEWAQTDLLCNRIKRQPLIEVAVDKDTGAPNLVNVRGRSSGVGFTPQTGPEASVVSLSWQVKELNKSPCRSAAGAGWPAVDSGRGNSVYESTVRSAVTRQNQPPLCLWSESLDSGTDLFHGVILLSGCRHRYPDLAVKLEWWQLANVRPHSTCINISKSPELQIFLLTAPPLWRTIGRWWSKVDYSGSK